MSFDNFSFVRDKDGRWYAELPSYPGPRDDLEMVLGADTLLTCLAGRKRKISLQTSMEPYVGHTVELERCEAVYQPCGNEGWYYVNCSDERAPDKIWLCEVMKYVFGDYPESIYFSLLSE